MNKKKKKELRKQAVKKHLKTIFGSLFKNQIAIDGARHYPWWVALIFFVLSICLPVIPVITSNMSVSGSDFMSSYTKGFDTYISAFVIDMNQNDVDLVVNNNNVLTAVNWEETYTYSEDRQYTYINENSGQIDFVVYFINETGTDFSTFNSEIASRQYQVGTSTLYVAGSTDDDESDEVYTPSYILFGPDSYVVQIFNPDSVDVYSYTSGDYVHVEAGTSIASFASNYSDELSVNEMLADPDFIEDVNNNFISFFEDGYLTNKYNTTLYSTLLTLGIYVLLALFMGLMIFLLTRGKKNIMHILSFFTCQKINAWTMLCPAILGMIVGFIFSDFAMVGFILFVGIRVMWMSFRQLKPVIR